MKWLETFGNPDSLKTWIGEPTVVSFHSVKNDAWYQRKLTIDDENGTLLIDTAPVIENLEITNNTGMFKAVTAYLETADGKTTLVAALSGSGYHELFKGTYEQAVANGDNTDNWLHGYQNADGKWEFRIPVAAGETYIPLTAISSSYYTKYQNGQNSLARAFYPRQFELDQEAKTLVTGDYEFTQELAITNNVKMFKVSGASLHTVGGPNSNNYAADLVLIMGSTSFDKAYVGTAEEAGAAAETVALAEGNVFTLPVKWEETPGDPETLTTWIGEPTVLAFHSVKNDAWYERQLTIDDAAGTLTIDDKASIDAAAAAPVKESLSGLKATEELTLEDKAGVEEARAAYDALTEDQKALISEEELKKLTVAEAKIAELEAKAVADAEAAAPVQESLAGLKAVQELTLEDKAAVEAARAAYDALTEDQKALVSAEDVNKLTEAEKAIQKLEEEKAAAEKKAAEEKAAAEKKAAADKQAAGKAADALKALPAADQVALTDKAAVEAARKAYDALSADQKKLVPAADLKKLTDAEAAIKKLEEEAAAAKEEPKVGDIIKTTDGTAYKVGKNDTVTYKAPAKKNAATLSVPATITVDGKKYTVTAIAANAFKNNKKLTKVTIGANIKTIGKNAFSGCTKITTLKLGKNVTTIGANAFKGNTALKKITIPKSVTKIGANAFAGCKKATSVKLGAGVKTIGSGAFKNNKALKSVTLNKKLTKISANAFSGCTKLTTVKIAAGTKVIGKNAFKGCKAIKAIVVPKTVTKIEAGAFNGCTALQKITFKGTKVKTIGKTAFTKAGSKNYKKLTVKVPAKSKSSYTKLLKKAGLSAKATVK